MSDKIRDQISAFMDGELPARECDLLLRRMRRDSELRHMFDRFGLIGDAIRDSMSGLPQGLLRDRVMEAVHGEQSFATPSGWRRWGRWLQPAAGVAVAASVAVVAVLALRGNGLALPDDPMTASGDSSLYVTVPEPTYTEPGAAPPTRLTNYLMNHSEYATTLGRKNMQTRILIDEADTEGEIEPQQQPEL
ncbi:hypothetical protein BH24PSE2_BH24PSE2_16460 [soil metagenome]